MVHIPSGTSGPRSSTTPAKSWPTIPPHFASLSARRGLFPGYNQYAMQMSVSSEAFREIECSKPKLTVCRVLCRCNNFDENLTRARLWHVYEAKGEPAFGHEGCSLLDGSHFLHTTNRSFAFYYFPNPSTVL